MRQTNKHLENLTNKPPQKSLSHININSIRSKLDSLFEFTYSLVDFLSVSETKLDSSFPTGQFNFLGFRALVYVNINIHLKC